MWTIFYLIFGCFTVIESVWLRGYLSLVGIKLELKIGYTVSSDMHVVMDLSSYIHVWHSSFLKSSNKIMFKPMDWTIQIREYICLYP